MKNITWRPLLQAIALFNGMLGLFPIQTQATVIHVDQHATGNAHDGESWCTAFTTVGEGVNAAQYGDDVWVAAGFYPECIVLRTGISLYGGFSGTEIVRDQRKFSVNRTTLDGQSSGIVVSIPDGARSVILDGFTIQNGSQGIDIQGQNSAALLGHNVITLNGTGISGIGKVTVENSVVSYNTRYGGISLAGDGDPRDGDTIIRNNLIIGNSAPWQGGGINLGPWGRPVVEGNTIVGNTAPLGGGLSFGPLGTAINNLIAFNSSGVFYYDVFPVQPSPPYPPPPLNHNCLFGNGSHDYQAGDNDGVRDVPLGPGVVNSDPRFVDMGSGDYRLTSGSPCIDAGNDSAVADGETDLNGGPRIQGAHVDLGAYEWTDAITMADVARALRIAGGLSAATPEDMARLSAGAPLGLTDAVRLARVAR